MRFQRQHHASRCCKPELVVQLELKQQPAAELVELLLPELLPVGLRLLLLSWLGLQRLHLRLHLMPQLLLLLHLVLLRLYLLRSR